MIKGFDLTVYEVLGYLVPGVVAFAGLYLAVGLAQPNLLQTNHWSGLGWWILLPLTVAYVLGHVMQALANRVLSKNIESEALQSVVGELPASGFEAIARRLQVADAESEIAAWKGDAKRRAFLSLCTEIADQDAKTTMRDVFLYREGFYRGTCLALSILAVGVALWIWPLWKSSVELTQRQNAGAAIGVVIVLAWTTFEFYNRYKRFVRYRISSCIWSAVTVATAGSNRKQDLSK